jgi:hypothetical protein
MRRDGDRMCRSERVLETPYGPYTISSYEEPIMSEQSTPARENEQPQVEYRTQSGMASVWLASAIPAPN